MTSPTKWAQWATPPTVPVGNAVYRVQLMVYRSADNISGGFYMYLNVAGGFMRFDLADYTAGQWTRIERTIITSTGVPLNDFGWVYMTHGYWNPLVGGHALVSDIRVIEGAAPQVSTQRNVATSRAISHDDIGTRLSLSGSANVTIGGATYNVPVGAWFEVYNNRGATAYIYGADGNTIRLAGTATTGTRTLAAYAMAYAHKTGSEEWTIGGWGVT